MIDSNIEFFKYGNVEKHKESQEHWLSDSIPIVETNIGFNETYLDPLSQRGEFFGMVAFTNK
jgi:dipeptidyl-peptidase III